MVFKKISCGVAYLLGNILRGIGILMDPGVEARIILSHRGRLYREVIYWENTS